MYRNRPQHFGALVSTLAIGLVMHSAGAGNPVQAEPAAPLASSFPGPLWEVVAPKGGTASVANAHLLLNVPGGSNHDPLRPSNESVQVVQPIGNQDFDISIKIDSEVVAADAGTSEGLIVLSNDKDFIIFALGTDGTNISLTARTVTAGVEATLFNEAQLQRIPESYMPEASQKRRCLHSLLLSRRSGMDGSDQLHRHQGTHFGWSLRRQLQQHTRQSCSCRYGHQLVRHRAIRLDPDFLLRGAANGRMKLAETTELGRKSGRGRQPCRKR